MVSTVFWFIRVGTKQQQNQLPLPHTRRAVEFIRLDKKFFQHRAKLQVYEAKGP